MKKVLKILSHTLLTLLFVGYIAFQFRTDPIGIVAGRALSGDEVAYPADWSFSNDHPLIAVETRPSDPHSVTTICWVHDGDLYVPARDGAEKEWTHMALADSTARIKVGDAVYPVRIERVMGANLADYSEALAAKYPQFADASPEDFTGTWIFRVGPR